MVLKFPSKHNFGKVYFCYCDENAVLNGMFYLWPQMRRYQWRRNRKRNENDEKKIFPKQFLMLYKNIYAKINWKMVHAVSYILIIPGNKLGVYFTWISPLLWIVKVHAFCKMFAYKREKNMLNKYTYRRGKKRLSWATVKVWICVCELAHVFGINTFCIIKAQSDVIPIWRSVDFLKYKQKQQIQMNFPILNKMSLLKIR